MAIIGLPVKHWWGHYEKKWGKIFIYYLAYGQILSCMAGVYHGIAAEGGHRNMGNVLAHGKSRKRKAKHRNNNSAN